MSPAEHETIREVAYMAAGAGAAAVMRFAPDVVMPTDDITEAVEAILREHGVRSEDARLP